MESRMNLCQRLEKVSVTSDGKGYASAAHDSAVEGHEHGKRHACRYQESAPAPNSNLRCRRSRHRRSGYGRGRHHILDCSVYAHIEDSHNGHAGNQRGGNATSRIANLTAHHIEIGPSVVSP